MKIQYDPKWNFHNQPAINLIITGETGHNHREDDLYLISIHQAKRIDKHFCGVTDCMCGTYCQVLDWDRDMNPTKIGIPVSDCEES